MKCMKKVIVSVIVSVISYHASAQEEKEKTDKNLNHQETVAMLSAEATSTKALTNGIPTSAKDQNKKAKKSSSSKPKKNLSIAQSKGGKTALTTEDNNEAKTKSRFQLMLEKRLKFDAGEM